MGCRERGERLDPGASEAGLEEGAVLEPLDLRGIRANLGLLDQWESQELLDLKDQEGQLENLDFLGYRAKMESQDLLEKEEHLGNMDRLDRRGLLVLLVLQVQLESQGLWKSLESLEPQGYLESQGAQEKLAKKGHQD